MEVFASFAEKGRQRLLEGKRDEIGPLMDANFDLRASIYPISEMNRQMVETGRSLGAHVKFSGSGGAVVGTCPDPSVLERLQRAYSDLGIRMITPKIS